MMKKVHERIYVETDGGLMYIKVRNVLYMLVAVFVLFSCAACGKTQIIDTENSQETETEVIVEITDAVDILNKVWAQYEMIDTDGNVNNDRFDVMGGHYETAVMHAPGKYDLNKVEELEEMYCIPTDCILELDDAATMIDLYNAGRFTVTAVHVTNSENLQNIVEGIHSQVVSNQWHGEVPEKLLIFELDGEYAVVVYGRESLVNEFQKILKETYSKQAIVVVEQKGL